MNLCWFGEAAPTDNRKSSLDSPGLTWNGTHNEFVLICVGFREPVPTDDRKSSLDSADQVGMGPTVSLCGFGEPTPTADRKSLLD